MDTLLSKGLTKVLDAKRWLRYKDLDPLFEFINTHVVFRSEEFGKSEEGRPLRAIYWGSGPKRLIIWTQMHGNEPTATHALDLLIQSLVHDLKVKALENKISLALVPMLNPDGAERFQRRNALGIDLNRDAVAQCSSEIQAFYNLLDQFKPNWAFNMHDQRNLFSIGAQNKSATLSFLAPSPNENRHISLERKASMQMIGALGLHLEQHLKGHFGRYTDEFYPKAIGDNLMKAGIPNILFEAGYYPNDHLREKSCFLIHQALLKSLELIVDEQWQYTDTESYFKIPENKKQLRDMIFRGLNYRGCTMDLALMRVEMPMRRSGQLEILHEIVDIGDLSAFQGIEEHEGGSLQSERDLGINQIADFTWTGALNYTFKNGKLLQ